MMLMIDNYDSFTYNLVQLLAGSEEAVEVARNDRLGVDELLAAAPAGVVLSPGPGRPEAAGISVELFRARPPVPILGVCLGHQALGVAFGGRVERASRPMHGKTSAIRHAGEGLFAGLPQPFEAARYHSLELLEEGLPEELEAVAWADDGTLQAVRHRQLPYWGVQFHPESILTTAGPRLVENFVTLCRERAGGEGADAP